MLVARVEFLGEVDARGAIRFVVDSATTARGRDGTPFDAVVEDFSRTGFRFVAEVDLLPGSLVSIGLGGAGAREARVVRRDGRAYGCEFLVPLPRAALDQAFRGQDAVLADLEAALERRFASRAEPVVEPAPKREATLVARLVQRLKGTEREPPPGD